MSPPSAWIKERPELCEKAVALVSIEHLGCTEWLSDAEANTYKPSGRNEIAFAFCPTKAVQDAGAEAMKGQKIGREVIISSPAHSVSPRHRRLPANRRAVFLLHLGPQLSAGRQR